MTDTPESTPVIDQAPILVFDGDCGFCTTSALWVARHWPEGPRMVVPKIVAWQALGDEGLHDLGLSREQANASAWWVDGRGQFGADKAIAKALLACRAPWSWLGGALVVPPGTWLGRFLYPVIRVIATDCPAAPQLAGWTRSNPVPLEQVTVERASREPVSPSSCPEVSEP